MDNSDKYALAEKICWNNQYYNSKLEMLWGAYFENKKINFEHETERRIYDKENNLYYTPDFTLVNFLNGCENLYVEIKPELTEKYIEEQKYAKFIQGESGKRKDNLLLVGGYPWGIYSKSYDYQLYTKSIVGVTVYGKEQLKSQNEIDNLFSFKNKKIFETTYYQHYNQDEKKITDYKKICEEEFANKKPLKLYCPHWYFLNMVNYYLNGVEKNFKWRELPDEVWKTAYERFNDLEKFIKYGLIGENKNGNN